MTLSDYSSSVAELGQNI